MDNTTIKCTELLVNIVGYRDTSCCESYRHIKDDNDYVQTPQMSGCK
jgi:hypothetical protein